MSMALKKYFCFTGWIWENTKCAFTDQKFLFHELRQILKLHQCSTLTKMQLYSKYNSIERGTQKILVKNPFFSECGALSIANAALHSYKILFIFFSFLNMTTFPFWKYWMYAPLHFIQACHSADCSIRFMNRSGRTLWLDVIFHSLWRKHI